MPFEVVSRMLWQQDRGSEKVRVDRGGLLSLTAPAVVLGEAGMGKTHLLQWMGEQPGFAYCTARQLINRRDPGTLLGKASVLVIDGLDEVGAQREGDAVDQVLRQLGAIGYPRFTLSCRVADWRSATSREAISEQYAAVPIQLYLEAFTEEEVKRLLSAGVGQQRADEVFRHFDSLGLGGLLGNPQTLEMILKVVSQGALPGTKAELFERATYLLALEHRTTKAGYRSSGTSGLDSAGAAFAALVLTSSGAISTADALVDELRVADIERLPDALAVTEMLDSRLFRAVGSDRFSYWHRRIGEFLAASWLSKQANTGRKRRRLLSLFHSHGLVPASLRGVHAWLAKDPALASAVIHADPMGVIEYGGADCLSAQQGRWLIKALENLAAKNPRFHEWGKYSVRGLVQLELVDEVRSLITEPDTPYGLRHLALESVKGAPIAANLVGELRAIIFDKDAYFSVRRAAAEALAGISPTEDWRAFGKVLLSYGDVFSIRLAIELTDFVGYENFDDDLVVRLVVALITSEVHVSGVLYGLERNLPISRIAGVLERLIPFVKELGEPHMRKGDRMFTDFAYHLVCRRVEAGQVDAKAIWSWLEPFDSSEGYQDEVRKRLDAMFRADDALRRSIQRFVLVDLLGDMSLWQRSFDLQRRSQGLFVTSGDVVSLLDAFDPGDKDDGRWRDAVLLIRHEGEMGSDVRQAAAAFVSDSEELKRWLMELSAPSKPGWLIEQEDRDEKRKQSRAEQAVEAHRNYLENIDSIVAGDYGAVVDLAKAYLALFSFISESVEPHERITGWVGEEIGEAALAGFEKFLTTQAAPAADIADALAESQHWEAGYIIVTALAERLRKGVGWSDISDDRIMTGFFELRFRNLGQRAGIGMLGELLEKELKTRACWTVATKMLIEPQLASHRSHVDGLYDLMRNDAHADAAADFAAEWLRRFADLPLQVEEELVDRMLLSGRLADLRGLCVGRTNEEAKHKRLWSSVALITDFEATSTRLEKTAIDPDLVWALRDRTIGRFNNGANAALTASQIEWIFSMYREIWPQCGYPSGGFVGDQNPWDASEYLRSLVGRLGADSGAEATEAIRRMRDGTSDGYTEMIKSVAAEQARARVERAYVAVSIAEIEAISRDRVPVEATDLQAFMLEELSVVQAKVRSDDAESWRGFFSDTGIPHPEERCRDHLLGLLRQGVDGVALEPESHVGGDREVDITCAAGDLRLPIEIKGQWHADLWTGADKQLDAMYARDWRADMRGIYLVLWFGEQSERNKSLRSKGRGLPIPSSASELQAMLLDGSRAARDGRISIVVMEIYRT